LCEWFWNGSSRPCYCRYHFYFHIPHVLNLHYKIWCDFDRESSLICGNKMPTRCNWGFYCRSYCLLDVILTVHRR
jgi:hypothetical protein